MTPREHQPMRDTFLDLHPDPLCVPTVATLGWLGHKSLATAWRDHIEYVINDDPDHPESVY